MDGVTVEAVAEFVARLAPMYLDDPVTVELLPYAKGCPFEAAIVWDPDRAGWYVLGNRNEEPRQLAEYLFHELAHAVYKDVSKHGRAEWVSNRRRAALGTLAQPTRTRLTAEAKATIATEAGQAVEDRAFRWARARMAQWWACLQDWKDPTKAAGAAWWAHNEIKRQNGG